MTGGQTVVFRCVVKAGNPPPAVVWEREENEPLNSSNDGVLVISPASSDSQGKYICKATNVLGSTEAVALLIVQGKITCTTNMALLLVYRTVFLRAGLDGTTFCLRLWYATFVARAARVKQRS